MKPILTYLFLVMFFLTNAQTKKEKTTKAIDSINFILKKQNLTASKKLKNLKQLIDLHILNKDKEELIIINNKMQSLALKEKDTFYLAMYHKANAIINQFRGNSKKEVNNLKKTIATLNSIKHNPNKNCDLISPLSEDSINNSIILLITLLWISRKFLITTAVGSANNLQPTQIFLRS